MLADSNDIINAKKSLIIALTTTKVAILPGTISDATAEELGVALPTASNAAHITFAIKSKNNDAGTIVLLATIKKGNGQSLTKEITISGYQTTQAFHEQEIINRNTQDIVKAKAHILDKLTTTKTTIFPSIINHVTSVALGVALPIATDGVTLSFAIHSKSNTEGTIVVRVTIRKGNGVSLTKDITIHNYFTTAKQHRADDATRSIKNAQTALPLTLTTTKTTILPSAITTSLAANLGITFPKGRHGTSLSFAQFNHDDTRGLITIRVTITKKFGHTLTKDIVISGYRTTIFAAATELIQKVNAGKQDGASVVKAHIKTTERILTEMASKFKNLKIKGDSKYVVTVSEKVTNIESERGIATKYTILNPVILNSDEVLVLKTAMDSIENLLTQLYNNLKSLHSRSPFVITASGGGWGNPFIISVNTHPHNLERDSLDIAYALQRLSSSIITETTRHDVSASTITEATSEALGTRLPTATHGTTFTFSIQSLYEDLGMISIILTISKNDAPAKTFEYTITGFKEKPNARNVWYKEWGENAKNLIPSTLTTSKTTVLPSSMTDVYDLGVQLPSSTWNMYFGYSISSTDDSAGTLTVTIDIWKESFHLYKDIVISGYKSTDSSDVATQQDNEETIIIELDDMLFAEDKSTMDLLDIYKN